MTLKQLLQEKHNIQNQLDQVQEPYLKLLRALNAKIEAAIQAPLEARRAREGKDTGIVSLLVDGVQIRETVPKTVTWDQHALARIEARLRAANKDPRRYITISRSVPEFAYRHWPEAVKKAFAPARTVRPGKPRVSLEVPEDPPGQALPQDRSRRAAA